MFKIDSFIITQEILTLIAEIDEFKGTWKAINYLSPERLNSLKKVATIESIGSSTRIEGAKLSDKEVEQLLGSLNHYSFANRDEEEVAGYAKAMEQIFINYQEIPFTENHIKQFHEILLQYSTKDIRHRGEYKRFSNHVEAFNAQGKSLGVVFETTSTFFETPFKMEKLVDWVRQILAEKKLHPLLVIGVFIVCFLAIHPFQDGNGRLSRILTTLMLLKTGYTYVPFCSLESIIEDNKDNYYLALRQTQGTLKNEMPDFMPWLKFFLHALQKQKNILNAKLKREKILMETLSAQAIEIIELIKQHGQMTISQLVKITNINRNTLKVQLRNLVKNEHLVLAKKGRSSWYFIR